MLTRLERTIRIIWPDGKETYCSSRFKIRCVTGCKIEEGYIVQREAEEAPVFFPGDLETREPIQVSGLSFEEALAIMKNRGIVRRACWPSNVYVYILTAEMVEADYSDGYEYSQNDPCMGAFISGVLPYDVTWTPNFQELITHDWETGKG